MFTFFAMHLFTVAAFCLIDAHVVEWTLERALGAHDLSAILFVVVVATVVVAVANKRFVYRRKMHCTIES